MSTLMDKAKTTIAENVGGPAHKLVPGTQQFALEDVPDLSGKVAVVTGGSEGIGYACTHTLLSRNIRHIYILSVSQEVVDSAVNAIKEEMGPESAGKVTWLQCDLSDWKAAKEAADTIVSKTDRIDILINNAARGIMTYQLTDLGVDRHMAVNHMGHVILNSHLLPVLKKTASDGSIVRIVTLGSNLHESAPKDTRFASLDELNQDLGPNPQYGRAKLAVMLYARYLAKHLTSTHPSILANAVHPGIVDTKMSSEDIHEPYPVGGYGMSALMKPFKKNNFQGAISALFAATTTKETGQYICPPAVVESGSALFQDDELAEQLMKLTREIIKEKTYDESAAKGCPFEDY